MSGGQRQIFNEAGRSQDIEATMKRSLPERFIMARYDARKLEEWNEIRD